MGSVEGEGACPSKLDQAFSLSPDRGRLGTIEIERPPGTRSEFVLVLPLPLTVRFHPDVQHEIGSVNAFAVPPRRRLQVDVPAKELALVEEPPDGVRCFGRHQHQDVVFLPDLAGEPRLTHLIQRQLVLRFPVGVRENGELAAGIQSSRPASSSRTTRIGFTNVYWEPRTYLRNTVCPGLNDMGRP